MTWEELEPTLMPEQRAFFVEFPEKRAGFLADVNKWARGVLDDCIMRGFRELSMGALVQAVVRQPCIVSGPIMKISKGERYKVAVSSC